MKKLFICALAFLTFTMGFTLVACDKEEHTHTYATEWKYDETQHWHEATCGHTDAEQRTEHTFGELVIDEEPTPTKNGHGHKTCSVCGLSIYNVEVEYVVDTDADVTLLFDVRGGEPIAPVTVKAGTTVDLTQYIYEGETIDSITYRVGDGQYLGGVYFDEALTNKLSYNQMTNYKPQGDITLYVVRKSL